MWFNIENLDNLLAKFQLDFVKKMTSSKSLIDFNVYFFLVILKRLVIIEIK